MNFSLHQDRFFNISPTKKQNFEKNNFQRRIILHTLMYVYMYYAKLSLSLTTILYYYSSASQNLCHFETAPINQKYYSEEYWQLINYAGILTYINLLSNAKCLQYFTFCITITHLSIRPENVVFQSMYLLFEFFRLHHFSSSIVLLHHQV